ncbi:unnamed protein product, partial [Acidithrix sp. C25]
VSFIHLDFANIGSLTMGVSCILFIRSSQKRQHFAKTMFD